MRPLHCGSSLFTVTVELFALAASSLSLKHITPTVEATSSIQIKELMAERVKFQECADLVVVDCVLPRPNVGLNSTVAFLIMNVQKLIYQTVICFGFFPLENSSLCTHYTHSEGLRFFPFAPFSIVSLCPHKYCQWDSKSLVFNPVYCLKNVLVILSYVVLFGFFLCVCVRVCVEGGD